MIMELSHHLQMMLFKISLEIDAMKYPITLEMSMLSYPPIKMARDRNFTDAAAEEKEMLFLPNNPSSGQIVTFTYPESTSRKDVNWIYIKTGTEGKWEVGRSHEVAYYPLEKVNEVKLIAKKEQEQNDLNNEGLNINGGSDVNVGGDDDKKTIEVDEKSIDKKNVVKPKKEKPTPPKITADAPFAPSEKYFPKENQKEAYKELKKVSDYLKENPSQVFFVHIYLSYTNGPNEKVGGKTSFSKRLSSDLAYARFITVRDIIISQSGTNPANIKYVDHYEKGSVRKFEVIPQK